MTDVAINRDFNILNIKTHSSIFMSCVSFVLSEIIVFKQHLLLTGTPPVRVVGADPQRRRGIARLCLARGGFGKFVDAIEETTV